MVQFHPRLLFIGMNFILNINDNPTRKNKDKGKKGKKVKEQGAKAWKEMKDDILKDIKKELKLSTPEANTIHVIRREMNVGTGQVIVMGWVSDPDVHGKINKKTI